MRREGFDGDDRRPDLQDHREWRTGLRASAPRALLLDATAVSRQRPQHTEVLESDEDACRRGAAGKGWVGGLDDASAAAGSESRGCGGRLCEPLARAEGAGGSDQESGSSSGTALRGDPGHHPSIGHRGSTGLSRYRGWPPGRPARRQPGGGLGTVPRVPCPAARPAACPCRRWSASSHRADVPKAPESVTYSFLQEQETLRTTLATLAGLDTELRKLSDSVVATRTGDADVDRDGQRGHAESLGLPGRRIWRRRANSCFRPRR